MAELCNEILEYYNGMKKYAKKLFDSNIKSFMVSDKYADNAEKMNEFLEKIEKDMIEVLKANRELDYQPVKMLIAYKMSMYLGTNNNALNEIFSKYG